MSDRSYCNVTLAKRDEERALPVLKRFGFIENGGEEIPGGGAVVHYCNEEAAGGGFYLHYDEDLTFPGGILALGIPYYGAYSGCGAAYDPGVFACLGDGVLHEEMATDGGSPVVWFNLHTGAPDPEDFERVGAFCAKWHEAKRMVEEAR